MFRQVITANHTGHTCTPVYIRTTSREIVPLTCATTTFALTAACSADDSSTSPTCSHAKKTRARSGRQSLSLVLASHVMQKSWSALAQNNGRLGIPLGAKCDKKRVLFSAAGAALCNSRAYVSVSSSGNVAAIAARSLSNESQSSMSASSRAIQRTRDSRQRAGSH